MFDLTAIEALAYKGLKPRRLLLHKVQLCFVVSERFGSEKHCEVAGSTHSDLRQLGGRRIERRFGEVRSAVRVAASNRLEHLKALIGCVRTQIAQKFVMRLAFALRKCITIVENFAYMESPKSFIPFAFGRTFPFPN